MYIFFSKNPNFFASTRPAASFFMAKLTWTKQLIDCGQTLDVVQSFYKDHEYSRQMPGKKDYLSIGWNVHKQKQLVLCNLPELYSAFRDKYPNIHAVHMCTVHSETNIPTQSISIFRMSLRKVTLFQALQNGKIFIWTNKRNNGYSRKYVNEILYQ